LHKLIELFETSDSHRKAQEKSRWSYLISGFRFTRWRIEDTSWTFCSGDRHMESGNSKHSRVSIQLIC